MIAASIARRFREDIVVAWHTHLQPAARRFADEARVMGAIWASDARVSLSVALRRVENALPKSYRAECEFCGTASPWMDSQGDVMRWSAVEGWVVSEEGHPDVCDSCAGKP